MTFAQDEWVLCRVFDRTTRIKKMTAYQVTMSGARIDQNQYNILDFAIDPVAPNYPNTSVVMPPMMLPMAGISGACRFLINDALFDNLIAALPHMNFCHQMSIGPTASHMGMEAIGQMDMGAACTDNFIVAALESRPSSMVS